MLSSPILQWCGVPLIALPLVCAKLTLMILFCVSPILRIVSSEAAYGSTCASFIELLEDALTTLKAALMVLCLGKFFPLVIVRCLKLHQLFKLF
jgi:hypothetical protein